MKNTYTTSTPKAFAQFFSEVNSEELLALQKEYENCHGNSGKVIEVLFFQEIPGECSKQLKTDTRFSAIKKFQFSDAAITRDFVQRQLCVTVVLWTHKPSHFAKKCDGLLFLLDSSDIIYFKINIWRRFEFIWIIGNYN